MKAIPKPAQKAINVIVQAQNPSGGWRYFTNSSDSDTSVTGWHLMALKSGQPPPDDDRFLVLDMPLFFGTSPNADAFGTAWRLVDAPFLDAVRHLDRWVNVWTIDDEDEIQAEGSQRRRSKAEPRDQSACQPIELRGRRKAMKP